MVKTQLIKLIINNYAEVLCPRDLLDLTLPSTVTASVAAPANTNILLTSGWNSGATSLEDQYLEVSRIIKAD